MFLNPITIIKKTWKIGKEFRLLSFYKKQRRKMDKSGDLKLYHLFRDYLGSLYAVINLQPEIKLYNTGKELEIEERKYVGNEISKMLPLFNKYDVYELVRMKQNKIDNDNRYGFGVVIKFAWKEVTFWWLLWLAIVYSGIGYGIYYLITTFLMTVPT